MQDEAVGRAMEKYFVATWKQKGNFTVNTSRWGEAKNGGNVVSYFCTPEGRVLHFVAGPIDGPTLLKEMNWAWQAYQTIQAKRHTSTRAVGESVRRLHHQQIETNEKKGHWTSSAHNYLQRLAMAPLSVIETDVFARYADPNVRTKEDEEELEKAIARLESSHEAGKPALLIITPSPQLHHHDSDKYVTNYDKIQEKQKAQQELLKIWKGHGKADRQLRELKASFTLTTLARDQLPALSARFQSATDLTPEELAKFEATRQSGGWFAGSIGEGLQIYIINHSGKVVAAEPADNKPALVEAMRYILQDAYLARADLELDKGKETKLSKVRRLARRIEAWPLHESLQPKLQALRTRMHDRAAAAKELHGMRRLIKNDAEAAREKLEQLVDAYPETPAAEEARQLLASTDT